MAKEINGTLISRVVGLGATEGGDHAYLEVELNDLPGSNWMIFRTESIGAAITALLAALGQAEAARNAATGGHKFTPQPADDVVVSVGTASDGTADAAMLTVLSGPAQLHFLVRKAALERLHSALGKSLAGMEEPGNSSQTSH